MKATFEISPDGNIKVGIRAGATFEESKSRIEALFAELGVSGIEIEPTSEVEQHRHDDQPAATTEHQHTDGTHYH